jgi:hypothetical protein
MYSILKSSNKLPKWSDFSWQFSEINSAAKASAPVVKSGITYYTYDDEYDEYDEYDDIDNDEDD